MTISRYNVAILGCGAIFSRHLAAIQANAEYFNLVGLYDPNTELLNNYTGSLAVTAYVSEDEAINDPNINCVILLTPSHLHYSQALKALNCGKHLIIEKPATFLAHEIKDLEHKATQNNLNIFTILQVRLNPAVKIVKRFIEAGYLGKIRGVSLIQRWQRPASYFSGWRGTMATGGGILREFGIHYLDTLQQLAGIPKVVGASFFNTKFANCDVSDTVYALFDFGDFGGSCEVSIAAEPKNLECSLSIMSDRGWIKLGGKSLDEIIIADFLEQDSLNCLNQIKQEVATEEVAMLAATGASPYHPELYRQIIINPKRFALSQTYNVVKLVENIYTLCL
jgi:UDP-N-acetyl-2-amino-2-deoxyglucuronate dehydrogenase